MRDSFEGSLLAGEIRRLTGDVSASLDRPDPHDYFSAVAEARYIVRKVFRLVEDRAKKLRIDPLAHQALIQVYGNKARRLSVSQLAERLDISASFASTIVSNLVEAGHAERRRSDQDSRVTHVTATASGIDLLRQIDESVRLDFELFARKITFEQRLDALSVLMLYVGFRQ